MGIFNRGDEVLDLTLLQKRGILKIKEDKTPDTIDYTKPEIVAQPIQQTSAGGSSVSPFDMLSSFAASANQNNAGLSENQGNLEISHVKVKIEDVEYKMERLMEKIEKIEERLIEFERNASRM